MSLKKIEELTEVLYIKELDERIYVYGTIKVVLDELLNYVKRVGEFSDKKDPLQGGDVIITGMFTPLRTLAGLDINGHSDEQNIEWIRSRFTMLKSFKISDQNE
jgi:hypothetical protein